MGLSDLRPMLPIAGVKAEARAVKCPGLRLVSEFLLSETLGLASENGVLPVSRKEINHHDVF